MPVCVYCGAHAWCEDEPTMATTSGIAIIRRMRCQAGHWWDEPEYIDVETV